MSTDVYEQGGIYLTRFAGPARTDGGSRGMVQLSNRSGTNCFDESAECCVMSVSQFDALLDWFRRNNLAGVGEFMERGGGRS